jgi:hypothetical protein
MPTNETFQWDDEKALLFAQFALRGGNNTIEGDLDTFKAFHNLQSSSAVKEEKEKDWEITHWYLDSLSKEKVITAVRRLSDGEVFKVGDVVNIMSDIKDEEGREIMHFRSYNDDEEMVAWNGAYGRGLSRLKKINPKPVLFTTADNVEIREGDECWWVCNWEVVHFEAMNEKTGKNTFSTKEAAEQYILHNKPELSLEEISKLWQETYKSDRFKHCIFYKKLLSLVQSKTNNHA